MRRKRDLFVSRVLKSRIASRILSIKEQAYKIASLLPRRSLRLAVVPLVLTRSFSMSLRVWNDANPSIIDQVVLPLDPHAHKGSSGRIGILGGSERYTGAPYYAARAALYVGIDLVTVYTATEAALPLKCYSPELMVVPVYSVDDRDKIVDQMVEQIVPDLERLHCLVIGPGLGRSPWVFAGVARIIRECRERNLLVVMDADALYMLTQPEYHSLLEDCANVILTPNVMEQKRLDAAGAVCNKATIVRKGQVDGIYKGSELVMECHEEVRMVSRRKFFVLRYRLGRLEAFRRHRRRISGTWLAYVAFVS